MPNFKLSLLTLALTAGGLVALPAYSAQETEDAAKKLSPTEARAKAYARVLAHLGAHPHWLYLFHPIDCMAHAAGFDGFSLDPKGYLRVA